MWEGEVEPCINGVTVANGAYFGVDMSPVVERLVKERLADGGWNCETESGSVRSSFGTTINVLDGLWNTSGPPVAPLGPGRRVRQRKSISWNEGCSAGGAPVSRPTSDSCSSRTRIDGATTCSGHSTISDLPRP